MCKSAASFAAPLLAIVGILTGSSWQSRAADGRELMRSSDFVQMIGVCVHMPYTDGAYANLANVLQDFKFLGINHARDGIPGTDSVPSMQARDAQRRIVLDAIRFNLIFPSDMSSQSATSYVRNLEKAVPNSVASMEGYNEINNFPVSFEGQTGSTAAVAGQKALYQAIKAEPDLKHIPVIDMTGFEMLNDLKSTYGNSLSGYADLMNVHVYAQNGDQPGRWINPDQPASYQSLREVLPKAITEFGYATMPESGWLVIGVDERTQAKGILNGLFDAARSGYDKVYLYELLDQKADPDMKEREFHFGLFTFENRPKIAAQAIRNVTKILAGAAGVGAAAKRGASSGVSPRATVNAPEAKTPVHSLGLLREDGSLIAAIWREAPFWDRAEGRPIEAAPVRASISFGRACKSIRLYDVLRSSEPTSVYDDGPFSLMLGDYVQLVECVN